jgi:hypothetical protein
LARDNPFGDFALEDQVDRAEIGREVEQMMEDGEKLRAGMLPLWRNANRPLRANFGVKNAVWRETNRPFRLAFFGLGGEAQGEFDSDDAAAFAEKVLRHLGVAGAAFEPGFVGVERQRGADVFPDRGVRENMLSWLLLCHLRRTPRSPVRAEHGAPDPF